MINLRDYQARAVAKVFKEWEDVRSTLVVQPTGTGKTTVFTEIISRRHPDRALILAHREELIFQAKARVENQIGLECQIEMADMSASTHDIFRTPVIAATVQTLISGNGDSRRMHRFSPYDFGLLVIDEGHHSTAGSYRKVIEHFSQNPDLKILGVTATPDRADEEALGQIFETVADVYEILDAIHDGWLVPIDQQMVNVEELDFSGIRTTAGDLNHSDLAKVMESEKNLHGVCGSTLQIIGKRQTIVFTSSVKHAEMSCEIFNRHRGGMAKWISGKTPKEERRKTMKAFHSGELQLICNVGCITEGVDVPGAEVVVMARPTKSRSLYAQMAGRILRPLPGLVDATIDPSGRRDAIKNSVKPSALIIDFAGNSGRHKLITSADILGGNVSEEAIELAVRKAREHGRPVRMDDELGEAEEEIRKAREEREKRQHELEARKKDLVAKVKYRSTPIDPFRAFGIAPVKERGWDLGKALSPKQRALLIKVGINPDVLSYGAARQILNEQFRRWKNNLCTMKQGNILTKFGYDTQNMTKTEASALLDKLAKNNWRRAA
jgi:superfamily II DNA or RNA helicase